MSSILEKVSNGLSKLKSLSEGPITLAERDKLIKQLKSDLTFF